MSEADIIKTGVDFAVKWLKENRFNKKGRV